MEMVGWLAGLVSYGCERWELGRMCTVELDKGLGLGLLWWYVCMYVCNGSI
jgi:hypothetical protein